MNSYEWDKMRRESMQEYQYRIYFSRGFWWGVASAYLSGLIGLIVGLSV